MAIIEVPDISIVKTVNESKQLLSLRDQKIKKDGVLHSFGVGSGVKYNGDLYVLGSGYNDVLFRMTTTGQNVSIGLEYEIMSGQLEIIDWGDGILEEIGKEHVYSDGMSEHEILIYRNINNKVVGLACSNNHLTSLDVSKCTALKRLICNTNNLTTLNINRNKELKELYCQDNNLSSLDVSINTKLTHLRAHENKLSLLDVGQNTELTELSASNNNLTLINLENNIKLTYLTCSNNKLPHLEVSNNLKLERIGCNDNPLISDQSALTSLANSLPDRTGKEAGSIQIINNVSATLIQDVCSAKNWTIL